jgi:hypothetical protein
MPQFGLLSAASILAVAVVATAPAAAKEVLIADVGELSGGGASNGVNWKEGLELAADEITPRAVFSASRSSSSISIPRPIPERRARWSRRRSTSSRWPSMFAA